MPTFTAPTYNQPVDNILGKHGISFPVGKIVLILDADDSVREATLIVDPTDIDLAKAGSGDFGKAIFRRGKTYTITSEEGTILEDAGYTVVP